MSAAEVVVRSALAPPRRRPAASCSTPPRARHRGGYDGVSMRAGGGAGRRVGADRVPVLHVEGPPAGRRPRRAGRPDDRAVDARPVEQGRHRPRPGRGHAAAGRAQVAEAPDLYVALTRAYSSGCARRRPRPRRHWRPRPGAGSTSRSTAATSPTRPVHEVLESVLFAHMVGLVTGATDAGRRWPTTSSAPCGRLLPTTAGSHDGGSEDPRLPRRDAAAGHGPAGRATSRRAMTSLERFPYYTAFPFAWYWAAYSDDLAAGEVRPVRYLARDLVLWRDEEGAAHVMDAYCPHLGANLALGGRVDGCKLVCPYHWWEWDGDGRNARIPYSERHEHEGPRPHLPDRSSATASSSSGTTPTPTRRRCGRSPSSTSTSPTSGPTSSATEWKVRCPWQELAENGPDFIHLKTVHGAATVPEVEDITYEGWTQPASARRVDFATPRGPAAGPHRHRLVGAGRSASPASPGSSTRSSSPAPRRSTGSGRCRSRPTRCASSAPTRRPWRRRHGSGDALIADLRKQMAEDNVIFDNKVHVPSPGAHRRRRPDPPLPPLGRALLRRRRPRRRRPHLKPPELATCESHQDRWVYLVRFSHTIDPTEVRYAHSACQASQPG